MTHLPYLIQDLGFILMTAAVVTLLCKKFKQPLVLGYLIAGMLVSPNFPILPSIKDTKNISIWAEIGVIFMLFSLGLEFSFKKLEKVGRSAVITASLEILTMMTAGYAVGRILGWTPMDSLFLGGILSISSTAIIVRAFDELGYKGKNFVSLVFGILIVQDIFAIVLLVILSSVAVTKSLSGYALLSTVANLGFFLVIWFLLGIYMLPVLLRKFKNYLSNETTLIVALGLCLMMVIVASSIGFSPALGAFVMGSLLGETSEGKRIETLLRPVKDLFSAVFFVSVGMLIDPQILKNHYGVIFLLTVVIIVGQLLSTTIGALISGRSLKNSVQAGMSLAQIGEFSFIIASVGMTLKVTSHIIYPIAVAVSVITTFTTPYMVKYSDNAFNWLDQRLPQGLKDVLARYQTAMTSSSQLGTFSLVWQEYGLKLLLNSVVVIAITLGMSRWALPRIDGYFGESIISALVTCCMTLIFSAPFLWAIFLGGPAHSESYKVETASQLRNLQIGIAIIKFLIGCALTGFILSNFTSVLAFTGVGFVVVMAVCAFFLTRYSEAIYRNIEARFLSNLTANEREELVRKRKAPDLAPWNGTLAEFVLSPQSKFVAQTLQAAKMKEDFGVTVAMIERGEKRILAPRRDEMVLPYDKIFLIGTDEQLVNVKKLIEVPISFEPNPIAESFGLTSMILLNQNPFLNKSIRDCGLREAVDGLIVGIERNGERMLSPDSTIVLQEGDLIWLVGDIEKIQSLDLSPEA
ncbi:MAG: cation:proton antiporter [Bdellovibrionales bacterium]|nr:cation:proton antiporter [Bdellovibrionales bacterium]